MNQQVIDESIERLNRLYERVTGQAIPEGEIRHPLNQNVDAAHLIAQRTEELLHRLSDPQVQKVLQPFFPPVAIFESDERIFIQMELAGVRKEDVDISVEKNYLIVSGTRKLNFQGQEVRARLVEFPQGPFVRVIPLPTELTAASVHSNINNGLLEIALPLSGAQATTNKTTSNKKSKTVN